jgi:hypothetical protein
MIEETTVKKVFKNIPEGKKPIGKPRKRWLDDVKNYVIKSALRPVENWLRIQMPLN